MVRAFHKLLLICVLTVPVFPDHFILQTNASALGLGTVLSVIRSGKELPVAYFAHQLRGAERNYSATEMEALAGWLVLNISLIIFMAGNSWR